MAKYQKDRRARLAAAVTPLGSVNPSCKAPVKPVKPAQNVKPAQEKAHQLVGQFSRQVGLVTPAAPVPCPNCERLRAELTRERAEVSRLLTEIAAMQEQPPATPRAHQDDTQALAARVIAAKVERINSYSRGHVIGSTRA